MLKSDILKKVDHTLLSVSATWEQIRELIDDAIRFEVASVCIPPYFVKQAYEYAGDKMKICTVIGFPNGYATTRVKCLETTDAIECGAEEIDMVINLGMVKEKKYDAVLAEINEVKKACGEKVLKVIIETCLLDEEEKMKLCEVVSDSTADFIKTSTGFSTGGATAEDVKLMSEHTKSHLKIKAAGGISDFEDAQNFIELGADRLGTSRLVKLAKQEA